MTVHPKFAVTFPLKCEKKKNLDFQLQLCVAEQCHERQQLMVCKCSLKTTLLQKQKELPCPCRVQANHEHSTAQERRGAPVAKILPKHINIGREVKAVIYRQGQSLQFYGLSLNNGGQEIHRKQFCY